jgi:hypothetical protein
LFFAIANETPNAAIAPTIVTATIAPARVTDSSRCGPNAAVSLAVSERKPCISQPSGEPASCAFHTVTGLSMIPGAAEPPVLGARIENQSCPLAHSPFEQKERRGAVVNWRRSPSGD